MPHILTRKELYVATICQSYHPYYKTVRRKSLQIEISVHMQILEFDFGVVDVGSAISAE